MKPKHHFPSSSYKLRGSPSKLLAKILANSIRLLER